MSTFPDKSLSRFSAEYLSALRGDMDRSALENAVQNRFGFIRNIAEVSDERLREMMNGHLSNKENKE